MDDKRIRIGVDNSEFDQYQSKMRQSAESLARDMIRSARGYTTSAKEVLSVIDEQIRAIEKRNKLDDDFRKQRLGQAVSSGAITEDVYKSRMSEVTTESREDKLHTQILRDILDSIKSTSKEEIREDRMNVEKRIQASTRVGSLNPEGDEFENLRQTIQQAELNRLKDEEYVQARGKNINSYMGIPHELASDSPFDLDASGMTNIGSRLSSVKGGVVGAIIALTAGALIKDMAQLTLNAEQNVRNYSILSGTSVEDMGGLIRGSSSVGRTGSETLLGISNIAMAARTSRFGESGSNLLNIERGTFLSESDIGGVAGLRRYGGSEVSPLISYFNQYLKQTSQDVALLPDIIQSFTNDARQIISETGRVDTKGIARFYGQVGEQSGFTGEVLTSVIGSLRGGMKPSSNPVMRMMQLRAARSVAGKDASFWETEKVMFDPNRVDYLQALLDNIKDVSGGGESYQRALFNMFGISPNLTEGASQVDLAKELQGKYRDELGKKTVSFEADATKTIGNVEKTKKAWETGKENLYYGSTEAILQFFEDSVTVVKKGLDELGQSLTKQNEVFEKMRKTGFGWFSSGMVGMPTLRQ